MVSSALATLGSTGGGIGPVVIGGLLVAIPSLLALVWTVVRGRRMAPREESDMVSRAAQAAVEAMRTSLDEQVRKREEMRGELVRLQDQLTVHERKEARLRGEISELRSRVARFDTEMFGMAVVDGYRGLITAANQRLHLLTGWPEGELVGKQLDVLIPADLRDQHAQDRIRYMQKPDMRPMGPNREVKVLRHDGTVVRAWIGLSPVDDTGLVAAAILLLPDDGEVVATGH